ncbi:hypothetical protein DFJ73DRAFT_851824 [Zopfochytrium polystomum]|nr:hypothetical protein DFJ73DRAFT_851824 [Zopfochytrium polystomum]
MQLPSLLTALAALLATAAVGPASAATTFATFKSTVTQLVAAGNAYSAAAQVIAADLAAPTVNKANLVKDAATASAALASWKTLTAQALANLNDGGCTAPGNAAALSQIQNSQAHIAHADPYMAVLSTLVNRANLDVVTSQSQAARVTDSAGDLAKIGVLIQNRVPFCSNAQ